jgi:hypothetical protein
MNKMNHVRKATLLAALLYSAACSSLASPTAVTASITMGDTVTSLRAFTSSASGSSVTVLGAIATPDPCYNFTAVATTTGNVVEATVKADTKGGTCTAVLNRQNYTLTVSGFPNGTWVVRVMHQEDGKTPLLQYETSIIIK